MRTKRLAIACLIVLILLEALFLANRVVTPKWDQRMPDRSTIRRMTADLNNPAFGLPMIPVFEVPEEDIPAVLNALGNGSRDFLPPNWQILGDLTITTNDGSEIEVHLFWTALPWDSPRPGAYAIGPWGRQVYYRGGNSVELE